MSFSAVAPAFAVATCLLPYQVKTATLTYKVVTLSQPLYLTHLLTPYNPGCTLQ